MSTMAVIMMLGALLAAPQEPAPPAVPAPAQPASPATARNPAPPASQVAFTLKEKDLIPAGIAHDPVTGTFFVGSLQKRKIVAVDPNGTARDFVARGQDGLWRVRGLRVDATRRHLWATTDGHDRIVAERGRSAAFKYDLGTGRLVRRYALEDGSGPHLFNDMAITREGTVFITDSKAGALYQIQPGKDELEPFTDPNAIRYPNGITISDDDRVLFVAHTMGIAVIDTATKARHDIRTLQGVPLTGIDGLYYYRGDLVAVQSLAKPERIVRLHLSHALDQVESAQVLESGHPLFNIPTTGVLAGDTLFYLANSQLESFDEMGRIWPLSRLQEPVILSLKLGP